MKYNDVRHVENAQRREEMRPVAQKYGFFKVADKPKPVRLCCLCSQDVPGAGILINEKLYHESCFVRSR